MSKVISEQGLSTLQSDMFATHKSIDEVVKRYNLKGNEVVIAMIVSNTAIEIAKGYCVEPTAEPQPEIGPEFEDSGEFTEHLDSIQSMIEDTRMLKWMEQTDYNYGSNVKKLHLDAVDAYANLVNALYDLDE